MPPDSSEGFLFAGIGRQADECHLERRDLAHGQLLEFGMLADGHDDVFGDVHRGKQGAILELHAGARQQMSLGLAVQRAGIDAQHFDRALACLVQADDGPQQDRLAGTRTTHQTDNLAFEYVKIEIVMDDVVAELRADAAQPQRDSSPVLMINELSAFGHHTPASRKMIENMASSTMTQKIASTTDLVVSWPTLSALPFTCRPSKQPIVAITMPNTGALIMPV